MDTSRTSPLLLPLVYCVCGYAQTAIPSHTVSNIQNVNGYLDICGVKEGAFSKDVGEALNRVPSSQIMESLQKAMDGSLADKNMCFAYLTGIAEGFKDGHEHGVVAAQFPEGFPKDEPAALKTLPLKQLNAASGAMKSDVHCLPEHISFGELNNTVVKYTRDAINKNGLMSLVPTYRMVQFALRDSYPCTADTSKTSANNVK